MMRLIENDVKKGYFAVKSNDDFINAAVLHPETGKLMTYRQLMKHLLFHNEWSTSSVNEFGRLAQGIGRRIIGTNTIFFINKQDIPQDGFKDVTYRKLVCDL